MNRFCFADFAATANCKQLVMSVCITGPLVQTEGQSHVSEPLLLIKFGNYLRWLTLNEIQLTVKLVYIFSIIILGNLMLESSTDL